jgi:misacylated tRNA(Ala) deacylase
MTETLYSLNCYITEFEATVTKITDNKFVVLDRTAFIPRVEASPATWEN